MRIGHRGALRAREVEDSAMSAISLGAHEYEGIAERFIHSGREVQNALQRLRRCGYVERINGLGWQLTNDGFQLLTARALRSKWLDELPLKTKERM